jgi:hypothetical protein
MSISFPAGKPTANTKKTWTDPIQLISDGVFSVNEERFLTYQARGTVHEMSGDTHRVVVLVDAERLYYAKSTERDHCPMKHFSMLTSELERVELPSSN